MPQNYFAQLQNALADFPTAARIKRGMQQQEFQNQMAQRQLGLQEQQFAGQQRQHQIQNALAIQEAQRQGQVAQAKQRKFSAEAAQERFKVAGPLAIQVERSENPARAYQAARERYISMFPEEADTLPPTYDQEAQQEISQLAGLYRQQQEPVGIEYQPTAEGDIVGLPKEVRPGQQIQPMKTGIRAEPEGGSAKEAEIKRYLDTGIARNESEATKLAEGLYEVVGPDTFGRSFIVDTSPQGGIVRELSTSPGMSKTDPQKTPATKDEKESFLNVQLTGEALGPISAAKQMVNNIVGPFRKGEIFPETEEARNKVRIFNQRIKPYFMVSSRGNTYEQQMMEKFLPSPDKMMQDPDAARSMLRNLHQMITANIESKQNLLQQGNITAKQRETFINDINNMQTALSLLPDKATLGMPLTESDVRDMSAQEIINMSDEELQALTPEAEAVIIQKAQQATGGTQ